MLGQGSVQNAGSGIKEGNPSAMLLALQPKDQSIPAHFSPVRMNGAAKDSLVDNLKAAYGRALKVAHNKSNLGLGDEHLDVGNFVPIQAVFHGVPNLSAKNPAAPVVGIVNRPGQRGRC